MICLTLFAGAGGADIGLSRAGFSHIACVEGDATACATLRAAGFPAVHGWIGTPPTTTHLYLFVASMLAYYQYGPRGLDAALRGALKTAPGVAFVEDV